MNVKAQFSGSARRILVIALVACLALVVVAGLLGARAGRPPDASEIYARTASSTVLVEVDGPTDSTEIIGTGFYVSPHLLLTCAHVTSPFRRCRVSPIFADWDSLEGRVLYSDSLRDVAVVYTDSAGVPLQLEFTQPDIGDPAYAIGNPNGYTGSLSSGVVSQLRADAERKRDLVQCSSLQEPGGSGGPLLNEFGQVIGMSSFVSSRGGFVFGVDVNTIANVLDRVSRAYMLSPEDARKALRTGVVDSAWAKLDLNNADVDVLMTGGRPIGGPEPIGNADSIANYLLILCLVLVLGAVLVRRHLRMLRLEQQRARTLMVDALRAQAFLPAPVVEWEVGPRARSASVGRSPR